LDVHSSTLVTSLGLVPSDSIVSDFAYVRGVAPTAAGVGRGSGGLGGMTIQGLALVKPPYGRITSFDLDRGAIVWQIAHGETPDNVRTHPALNGQAIPRTGQRGIVGTLVTGSLVIAGEPQFTAIDHPRGRCCARTASPRAPRYRRGNQRRRLSRRTARLQVAGMMLTTITTGTVSRVNPIGIF
jgi:hypothetical protein